MTIVVTWYRNRQDEVWCAADTRLSRATGVVTDHGAKVLPIPIVRYHSLTPPKWTQLDQFSLGFVYAGSNLSATTTHALASACTQNFGCLQPDGPPPSVSAIAQLFRQIGEHCVTDLINRNKDLGPASNVFIAHIVGYCRVERQYKGFQISPLFEDGKFRMQIANIPLTANQFFPFGSGKEELLEIMRRQPPSQGGVIPALREIIRRGKTPSVGGHFQVGIADRSGFRLAPMLNIGGPQDRHVTFLGLSVSDLGEVDGHVIGCQVWSPDVD